VNTDQVLAGIGLIITLAVGCQVLASKLRIPALILLLPAGFTAGALTNDVNPNKLLGPAFGGIVPLAVAVILYDAGLGLDLKLLSGHAKRVAIRLIVPGVLITWAFATGAAGWLLGISWSTAIMLGAILVVSGPTVVNPLLDFVRPKERLQRVLAWEGTLIDPIGGILGAVVFHAVLASTGPGIGHPVALFAASLLLGLAGGVVGLAVLWLLLCKLDLGEALGTTAQLAVVVGIAAACDIIRSDTGLIAAAIMGLAVANLPGFDIAARRSFFETLVQLIIGVLFVSISATVTPASIRHLGLPTLATVAILVLIARPVVAAVATWRTNVSRGERAFIGWMAPRGIVAAATASTFSTPLILAHVGGAQKILPVTFQVIVATVCIYGLSALPVARHLGVMRSARTRPLLVGGEPWVIDLGRALKSLGLDVVVWASPRHDRSEIDSAGLEVAHDQLLAEATSPGAELAGITSVLLLTDEDDFNELASIVLPRSVDGPVCYLGATPTSMTVDESIRTDNILFAKGLDRPDLARRYRAGERIMAARDNGGLAAGHDILFLVRRNGQLVPSTHAGIPAAEPGDAVITLGPMPSSA
jgi:NhaP-type Na+/H+ or K+/H+ antiporter